MNFNFVFALLLLSFVGVFAKKKHQEQHTLRAKAKVGVVPANTVYQENNAGIVQTLGVALINRAQIEPEDCPWVVIGNQANACLYTSLTITGDTSWMPIVEREYQAGKRNFAIFTGRHGSIPNKVDNVNGETHASIWEPNFVTADTTRKTQMDGEHADINIEMVDCNQQKTNHLSWLRAQTTQRINAGTTVVWAWCYSIFSNSEADADAPEMVIQSHNEVEIAKSIRQIVTDGFSWCPRP